ncbi:hypothetical protein P7C70_g5944, partial [Phenoliferia sp. Uapishka_3]
MAKDEREKKGSAPIQANALTLRAQRLFRLPTRQSKPAMPPRTRKGKSAAKASTSTIDLTNDSDSEPAPPPKKVTRTSLRSRKAQPEAVEEEEEDEGGIGALARQLRREEEEEDDMKVEEAPVASGSGSNSRPRRKLARGTSSTASVIIANVAPTAPANPLDPKALLLPFRDLFIPGRKCSCGGEISAEAYARPLMTTKLSTEGGSVEDDFMKLGSVECGKCKKNLCRGCWEEDRREEGVGKHCAEQRAVILYEVLAALDSIYLTERLKKPITVVKAAAKGKKRASQPKGAGAGVGYGTGQAGMGYGGYGGPGGDPYAGMFDDYDTEEEQDYYDDFMDEYGYPPPPHPSKANGKAKVAVEPPAAPLAPSHAKDLAEDKLFHTALTLISKLLPHPDSSEASVFDYLPHASLAPMLTLSSLQDLLATLLRNDSVGEWTRRSEVYFGLLGILTSLSESESVLGVLFGERWEKKWSEGLGRWMEGSGGIEWERKDVVGTSVVPKGRGKKRKNDEEETKAEEGEVMMGQSLFSLLRRLVTQADAFRKAATTGEVNADDVILLGLCGDISSAGERCVRTLKIWDEQRERDGSSDGAKKVDAEPLINGNGKGKGRAVEAPSYTDAQYSAACRTLAYDSISLAAASTSSTSGLSFPTHYYNKDIIASAASQRPHGGFVHLAKELAVLSTSLPPGIFLRVDEARIDVIKCLIAGPEGTPYAGGLFEFDIFVPLQYPQVAPKCWLKTTGGGAVRFNPNLYAEGKVCLSILGTWPGRPDEMWQPGSSTILQVLISIQAMILGSDSGTDSKLPSRFGAAKDSKPSKDYNANVSLATVKHAILYWLQDSVKDGIWGDVVATHFTFNRPAILAQIKSWAAKDKRMRKWTSSLNRLAGSHMPEGYPGGDAHYIAAIQAQQNAAYLALHGVARPAPPPQASQVEKDLVADFEAAMEKVVAWKEPAFFLRDIPSVKDEKVAGEDVHPEQVAIQTIADLKSPWKVLLSNKRTLILIIAVQSNAIIVGFEFSLPGNLLGVPAFVKQFGAVSPATGEYAIAASSLTIWAALFATFQVIGQFTAGAAMDRWGRRSVFYSLIFWTYLGVILEIVVTTWQGWLGAKIVIGFATGLMQSVVPCYVTEIAPREIRGIMLSFFNFVGLATNFATFFVLESNRIGRWGLLFGGAVLSLSSDSVNRPHCHSYTAGVMLVFFVALFIAGSTAGPGATGWIYTGEVGSSRLRAKTTTLATMGNRRPIWELVARRREVFKSYEGGGHEAKARGQDLGRISAASGLPGRTLGCKLQQSGRVDLEMQIVIPSPRETKWSLPNHRIWSFRMAAAKPRQEGEKFASVTSYGLPSGSAQRSALPRK